MPGYIAQKLLNETVLGLATYVQLITELNDEAAVYQGAPLVDLGTANILAARQSDWDLTYIISPNGTFVTYKRVAVKSDVWFVPVIIYIIIAIVVQIASISVAATIQHNVKPCGSPLWLYNRITNRDSGILHNMCNEYKVPTQRRREKFTIRHVVMLMDDRNMDNHIELIMYNDNESNNLEGQIVAANVPYS